MTPIDLPPLPKLWLPPKPAIVRAASLRDFTKASFAPGWFPAGAAAAKAVLSSIVQQASATSTAQTITAPADIQAGDLLVLADRAQNTGTPTTVVPSGFTEIVNTTDGIGFTQRQIFSRKIADGSEASASLTGMNGNLANHKVLLVFRPNVPFTTESPNTFGAQHTTGNPSAQTVSASGGTPPLIIFAIYGALDGTIDPRTFTVSGSPAKDGEVGVSNRLLNCPGFLGGWLV